MLEIPRAWSCDAPRNNSVTATHRDQEVMIKYPCSFPLAQTCSSSSCFYLVSATCLPIKVGSVGSVTGLSCFTCPLKQHHL